MSINQIVPWGIVIILILICSWLVFHIFDQSVTLDHQTQHLETIIKQRNLLVKIINSEDKISEKTVMDILSKLSKESVFEKAEAHVVADQVSFFFTNGNLNRIDIGQPD
ncbi:MAG: hypothetical protein BA869_11590 [Desulfuromonadales bacterium C00003107]|jgi:hypothetical protein|nr:MAG: hypothetical protein BA869_11590 [Desulfuromonadales bacterium C00003107]